MARKRRSLLDAPEDEVPTAVTAVAPPLDAHERTPATDIIPRRTDTGAPPRQTPPPVDPAPATAPTPGTQDRLRGDWFLGTGQSPPERTGSGEAPALVEPRRNPWLWVAPIAGVAAVGLLFVMALAAALVLF